MTDYLNIDTSTVTLEEALHDEEWGKQPCDFCEYVTVDMAVLSSFVDFTDGEIAEVMRTVMAYCIDGVTPNYSALQSAAVKIAVRSIVAGHQRRMNTEYLKRYKQYVGAKQRQARLRDEQTTGN